MNRGLYIGATSLVTNQRRLDVLSNNLANVNTTGFKKDTSITESFPEKLLAKLSREPEFRNIPGVNEITYENDGEIHTARTKEGYFMVETSRGRSHVKDIRFVVDEEGFLKTAYKDLEDNNKTDYENYILDASGNRVQGQDGDMENMLEGIVFNPPAYVVGTMSGGVRFQKVFTDFTHGSIIDTGGKLDLAIKGEGFFKIAGEDGETFYTRNGSFAISNGLLTDLDGRMVLGREGPIQIYNNVEIDQMDVRIIGEIDIAENGQITIGDQFIDYLDMVTIENKEMLRKTGDNLFVQVENGEVGETPFTGQILQGHLETSNMNAISGMVEMITLLRDFEANQKVIKMQDEMLEKAATEIGKA